MALKREPTASGPVRELFDQLHELHLQAGEPGLRQIARGTGVHGPSYTTVHNVFKGPQVPKWPTLRLIVLQLGGDVGRFHTLWTAARSAESGPHDRQQNGATQASSSPTTTPPSYPFLMVSYRLPLATRTTTVGVASQPEWKIFGSAPILSRLVMNLNGAWLGLTPDETADPSPPFPQGLAVETVQAAPSDVTRHYEGYCSSSIWPLYHYSIEQPEFRTEWRDLNRRLNQKFADKVVDLAAPQCDGLDTRLSPSVAPRDG
ncbi:hypothetical protein Ais01nite_60250 [Asanoa ishikariensis]|uniref:trehalose-6-phosphate synthase n=1 Tax=Asanoa ishikariensis TaxID=137265 RepID=UPI00115FB981|nr:trehalose-6-phosphate synthase [Asanoa ishikariensis]GIF67990.1 hypothetical protein Ais01nite_60250 [Asanoa ishikariensis]